MLVIKLTKSMFTQTKIIQNEITNLIVNKNMTDKQAIFTVIVEKLGVPRPTVRRAARQLKMDLHDIIHVLDGDVS